MPPPTEEEFAKNLAAGVYDNETPMFLQLKVRTKVLTQEQADRIKQRQREQSKEDEEPVVREDASDEDVGIDAPEPPPMQAERECPSCHTMNERQAEYCKNKECQRPLLCPNPDCRKQIEVLDLAGAKCECGTSVDPNCPSCGTWNRLRVQKCKKCKRPLICAKCNTSLRDQKADVLECPKCGLSIMELGNRDSAVPLSQLSRFLQRLQEEDLGFPVFSVSDCNTFHTSGYIWGAYAVRKLKEVGATTDGAVAIVNLDQHADSEGYNMPVAKSSAWGGALRKTIEQMGYTACFLTLFNGATNDELIKRPGKALLQAEGKRYAESERFRNDAGTAYDYEKIWQLAEEACGKKIRYLFVAIDRDCLEKSYNQWGEGLVKNANLVPTIKDIVAALRKESTELHVIGCDICGLPERRAFIRAKCEKCDEAAEDVFEVVNDELWDLWDWVNTEKVITKQKGGIPARKKSINNVALRGHWDRVIFYSGSISYHDKDDDALEWRFHGPQYVEYTYKLISLFRAMDPPRWQYIVSRRKTPVYVAGNRPFYLYRGTSYPVNDSGEFAPKGEPTSLGSISSTASRLSGTEKLPFADMVNKKGVFDPEYATCQCKYCSKRTKPKQKWPGVKMQTGGAPPTVWPGPPEVY